MRELQVRIVKLEPLRAAYALGFGPSPEGIAWEKLMSWAKRQGLLESIASHRLFGFNNPNPHPGSPNYGYEQWMTVGQEVQPEGDIRIKEFPGGLFAVARCTGTDNIFNTWQQLVAWQETSHYKMANNQCLEECLNPQVFLEPQPDFGSLAFDLYLPIAE